MLQRLGVIAFGLGLVTVSAVSGTVSDLGPEAGVTEFLTLTFILALGYAMSTIGLGLINQED